MIGFQEDIRIQKRGSTQTYLLTTSCCKCGITMTHERILPFSNNEMIQPLSIPSIKFEQFIARVQDPGNLYLGGTLYDIHGKFSWPPLFTQFQYTDRLSRTSHSACCYGASVP
jgi:hypothetical protein